MLVTMFVGNVAVMRRRRGRIVYARVAMRSGTLATVGDVRRTSMSAILPGLPMGGAFAGVAVLRLLRS